MLRTLDSPEAAEDVVQDVFFKIWLGRENLKEIQHFSAYLFRMAQNHAINGLRRDARKKVIYSELNYHTAADEADAELIRKDATAFIHQIVAQLPSQQQKVYLMGREQGLKHQEIAERLQIAPETVKKHMMAAMRTIRTELEKNYGSLAVIISIIMGLR